MDPLGAIYFSPDQCSTLQNLAAQAYLPKLGFNRKLPKAILFGSTIYGGWGKKDLYIQMIIQQTKLFLGHIRNKDETGRLLISKLEYTQLVSGIGQPILHNSTPTSFLQWTPTTW